MPVEWKDVKPGLDPKKWTIRNAPAQVAAMTAWKDYCDSERSLDEAIRRLGTKTAA
jgi:bifunctional non-homologous end joining protein LigD